MNSLSECFGVVSWPFPSVSSPSSQAMASLGPHRVKVDGKSFLLVLSYSQYLAECSDRPAVTQEEPIQYLELKVLKLTVEKETSVASSAVSVSPPVLFIFPSAFLPNFYTRAVHAVSAHVLFFLQTVSLQFLQSSRTDITMWRAPRTVDFSMTTSGTAGDRPSASTGRTSTRLGVCVCLCVCLYVCEQS